METKKPRISILDPRFKYRDSASTDVGRHLRAAQRKQRALDKAREQQPHEVVPMRKRSAQS